MTALLRGVPRVQRSRIERHVSFIDVDENRRGACRKDRSDCRHGRVRHGDDLVARANSERFERQYQRIGAASDADGVSAAAKFGKCTLKRLHFRAENIGPALQHSIDGASIGA